MDGDLTTLISNHGQTSAWKNILGNIVIKVMKKGNQFWVQVFAHAPKLLYEVFTFLSGYKLSSRSKFGTIKLSSI